MSLYSNLREVVTDAFKVIEEKDSTRKIIHSLEVISALSVLLIYLTESCNFRSLFTFEMKVGLPIKLEELLPKYCIVGFIVLCIYSLFLERIIRGIVIHIEVNKKKSLLPIKETIEDIYEIMLYGCIALKVIFDLMLCISGQDVIRDVNRIIFVGIILCSIWNFIFKIYIQKLHSWYYSGIHYTNFFDVDGKRIAEKDNVVYRNKLYSLQRKEDTWYLYDEKVRIPTKEISLEKAVMDSEGKLKVHYWGMGERKIEDK